MLQLKIMALGFAGGILAIVCWVALQYLGIDVGRRTYVVTEAGDIGEDSLRDFLTRNPDLLADSLKRLEQTKQAAESEAVSAIIAARSGEIFDDPDSPVSGNPQGGTTVVEFFDYNCPYCRRVAPTLIEVEERDPDLRVVYKEWPILGPGSEFAARAALAARQQGRYLAFHRALLQVNAKIDEVTVLETATKVGLDVDRLKQDMQNPEISQLIQRNHALAKSLGIRGTPSFVIGDQVLRGAASAQVIQSYIKRAKAE